jgi:hypothetical protein
MAMTPGDTLTVFEVKRTDYINRNAIYQPGILAQLTQNANFLINLGAAGYVNTGDGPHANVFPLIYCATTFGKLTIGVS